MNIKEFQFKLFGYMVEITIHKSKYSHKFAKELLQKAYLQESYLRVPKITLIKVLRTNSPDYLTITEAKEMIEDMFQFDSSFDGSPGLPRFK